MQDRSSGRYTSNTGIFRQGLNQPAFRYFCLFALFFFLLYLRRSAQLLHPQVWDEDGTQIIPGLLDHGLRSLFYPVNGYLILVPKLISAISLSISGLYYPLVSTVITWFFIIGVCIAIAISPIWLKGGVFLGAATLLIPSDPEAFGIPLYSFWWASLLLFLVVLWDDKSIDLKWRISFTLLGGLSSPIIVLVAPLLILRAVVLREKRREAIVAATAVFCCLLQSVVILRSVGTLSSGSINERSLRYVLPRFLGGYLTGNFNRTTSNLIWLATGFFIAFCLMTIPFIWKRPWYLYVIGLWCGSIYLIGRRVDLSLLQPRTGAPRYFFLPFVLVSWFLVSVLVECKRLDIKSFAAFLVFISLVNMLPVRTRPQNDFHWRQELGRCSDFPEYSIPISFNGQDAWFLKVNRAQCQALQQAGLIRMRLHVR